MTMILKDRKYWGKYIISDMQQVLALEHVLHASEHNVSCFTSCDYLRGHVFDRWSLHVQKHNAK